MWFEQTAEGHGKGASQIVDELDAPAAYPAGERCCLFRSVMILSCTQAMPNDDIPQGLDCSGKLPTGMTVFWSQN